MSVVKDFHQLKKYNIQELTMTPFEQGSVSTAQDTSKEPISDTNSCPQD